MLRDGLCAAFYDRLRVTQVPCGYAVGTAFTTADGDNIGFYVVRAQGGAYRLEDDGTTVPMLEAIGVSLSSETRKRVFEAILEEYGFRFEGETQTLCSHPMPEVDVPEASLRFAAMLLRLQDLELLAPRVAESTFREDALAALHERFDGRLEVVENVAIGEPFLHYPADALLRQGNLSLAAVFLGTSHGRVDEAVMLHMELALQRWLAMKVILLLETVRPPGIPERVLARAHNHLDAIPVFRGHQREAMDKIDATVFGERAFNG